MYMPRSLNELLQLFRFREPTSVTIWFQLPPQLLLGSLVIRRGPFLVQIRWTSINQLWIPSFIRKLFESEVESELAKSTCTSKRSGVGVEWRSENKNHQVHGQLKKKIRMCMSTIKNIKTVTLELGSGNIAECDEIKDLGITTNSKSGFSSYINIIIACPYARSSLGFKCFTSSYVTTLVGAFLAFVQWGRSNLTDISQGG